HEQQRGQCEKRGLPERNVVCSMTGETSIEHARWTQRLKWGEAPTVGAARNACTIHGPRDAVKTINQHDKGETNCHDRKLGREWYERAHLGRGDDAICRDDGSPKNMLIGRRQEIEANLGEKDQTICPPQSMCEN